MSRLCYKTNAEAVQGAIAQMAEHEALGDQASVDNSAARQQVRVQARFDSNQRHCDLMHKLRIQNKEAVKVKELSSEIVYPQRKF
jgi:hypothetical protein